MKTVLVTGAAGFIGSHLSEHLLTKGYRVLGIDNLITGQMRNILSIMENPSFDFTLGDVVTDKATLGMLVDQADVVYHLAAAVGVKLVVGRPIWTIETNLQGTQNVLREAAKKGKRVVVASTSEVYGLNEEPPFKETDALRIGSPTYSRWGYACSKAMDEFLALAYHKENGLPVSIIRFFNCSGARQTDAYGMVVPTFVKQAMQGNHLTVHGDGTQIRCFGSVHDYVEATLQVGESPYTAGEIYNVGTPSPISIGNLARLVLEIVNPGDQSNILFTPYEEVFGPNFQDMKIRIPSIDKIRQVLGWTPTQSLRDIIYDVWDYEKQRCMI